MSKRLESRLYEKAFRSLAADVAIEVIDTMKYRENWKGFESSRTRRVNGTKVYGDNRDINDTGELINSMKFKLTQGGYFTRYELSFSAEHYQYVRFGTKKVAGRDFVGRGMNKATKHQPFEKALEGRLNKV